METADVIQHSPDLGYGTIVPIRMVRDVCLKVAPGQPADPEEAVRFVLNWWEKDPPREALGLKQKAGAGCADGWTLLAKVIGPERARPMIVRHCETEEETAARMSATWRAMFGPTYAVQLLRGEEA